VIRVVFGLIYPTFPVEPPVVVAVEVDVAVFPCVVVDDDVAVAVVVVPPEVTAETHRPPEQVNPGWQEQEIDVPRQESKTAPQETPLQIFGQVH